MDFREFYSGFGACWSVCLSFSVYSPHQIAPLQAVFVFRSSKNSLISKKVNHATKIFIYGVYNPSLGSKK